MGVNEWPEFVSWVRSAVKSPGVAPRSFAEVQAVSAGS